MLYSRSKRARQDLVSGVPTRQGRSKKGEDGEGEYSTNTLSSTAASVASHTSAATVAGSHAPAEKKAADHSSD